MLRFGARAKVCTLVGLLTLSSVLTASGQVVTGAILGRVTDTTGAVMPGATIQIQNVDTGLSRTVQADSEGRYLSRNLPLGSYTVTAQQPGFQTLVRRGIVLTVGSEAVVNMELAVGAVQEKVEVTAEAPVIETTTATLSGMTTQAQLRDLPLNGRNVDQLSLLHPGVFANRNVRSSPSTGTGMRISVNGGRPSDNAYLLDGTVANDHGGRGLGGATGARLGVESILEFRVLAHNFSAEYGRNSGGVFNAVTRSGTNEFHGSAYEFHRNDDLDARNFFNKGELPPFVRNQFGAAAGGPLIKDRIFFFANYEGLRERQGTTVISSVPDADARRGFVRGQPVTLNPAAVPFVNLYPLPNGRNFGDGTAESVLDFSNSGTEDYAMERMDFRLSDNDNLYFRYVYNPSDVVSPETVPTFATRGFATNHYATVSETHIFSGASLNEFRFAFNRTSPGQDSAPVVPIDPSLSFVPGQVFGTIRFSNAGIGGLQLSDLGVSRTAPQIFTQNIFQATDTFSTVRGAHSLKFGVDFQRIQINLAQGSFTRGAFQFSGLTSLLAGQATRFNFLGLDPPSARERGWRRIMFGWFVQDDFRLRPNLTLTLGLRHEFLNAPNEVNGRRGNLRNSTDPANTPGPPFEPAKANFAPRVGLAWDPTGSGKTSVRAAGGVFHNQVTGRIWYHNANQNADFLKDFEVPRAPFPNGLSAIVPGTLQRNWTIQFHLDTPTVVHYNVEIQRQLAPTLNVRAGYAGSYGYNMPRWQSANIRIAEIRPDGSKFFASNAPFINPNFGDIGKLVTDSTYHYDALEVSVQKTVSAGLQLQASYTLSKALSDADESGSLPGFSIPGDAQDPFDLSREYSRSIYDQRHTLVLNGSYHLLPLDRLLTGGVAKALLGGWTINGIYSYNTGAPVTILSGFNNSRNDDRFEPDRPNLNPGFSSDPTEGVTAGCQGVPAGQKLGTPDRFFDPCAFGLPEAGTFGNLGRNTVTGPTLNNFDFTVVKDTPLKESKKLEFRAEFFNLFNRANFFFPNIGTFNSSRNRSGNAGRITSTTTSNRQIQLGMKLIF